jgi:thiol-disulfide isomerase/thioredoxin
MKKAWIGAMVFVACLAMAVPASAGLRLPEITAGKLTLLDEAVPVFGLPDANSGQMTAFPEAVKGRVTILTFMQTSCSSCKQLMDRLQQVAAKRGDITVVAVAIDFGGAEMVAKYAKYFGFGGITFLADPQMSAAKAFNVSFTPVTFLVDRQGKLRALMAGFDQEVYQSLERKADELSK